MKKKTNTFISDWLLPIIGLGSIFLIFFNLDKLTFVPDISFCSSYQFILCDIPILRIIVRILDTRVIAGFAIYGVVFLSAYFFLKKLGFKDPEDKTKS